MPKTNDPQTSVYLRDLDPDVRRRAEAEAARLGFKNLIAWMRRQVYELARDRSDNGSDDT